MRGQIGIAAHGVGGGNRAVRRRVVTDLESAAKGLAVRALCGPTGCGKSRLLGALHHAGAQVLDLEVLAQHRGSVLGALPDAPQPSQKRFETRLWQALREFDPARPVFVESESRTIGRLRVPEALLQRKSAATCLRPVPYHPPTLQPNREVYIQVGPLLYNNNNTSSMQLRQ